MTTHCVLRRLRPSSLAMAFACRTLVAIAATLMVSACDQRHDAPTAVEPQRSPDHSQHFAPSMTTVGSLALEPFTFRSSLDPYSILQLPDFMIRSNARSDIVMQRSVFAPGAGPWHTHPGPSFIYVIEGQIRQDRVTKKGECVATPVFGPGSAYSEFANEVHRAVVVSAESAVLLVTRLNIPIGGALSTPAADPGC